VWPEAPYAAPVERRADVRFGAEAFAAAGLSFDNEVGARRNAALSQALRLRLLQCGTQRYAGRHIFFL
jgi:hypothetical protein